MNKILYCVLGLLLLAGCSKDEDAPAMPMPKQGQYVAEYGNVTAAVSIGTQVTITVYTDRRYTYQDTRTGGHPSGSWPDYTYAFADNGSGAELIMHCSFTDPQNFTAASTSGILPATLHFRHDSRVLDANGDGVLD